MRILMCTDGSPYAQEAVRLGAHIARATDSDTTLLVVADEEPGAPRSEDVLRQCRLILNELGLAPHVVTRAGIPAEEIVRETEERAYDLVVIGAFGRRGLTRFLVGSTAYRAVSHVPIDTLVVKGRRRGLECFLLCTAAQGDERAIEVGGRLAQMLRARVTLLHIIPPLPIFYLGLPPSEVPPAELMVEDVLEKDTPIARYLHQAQKTLLACNVPFTLHLRRGQLPDEIFAEARRTEADLIVIGDRAHTGLARFLLGGTADKIIKYADRPVLVVRT